MRAMMRAMPTIETGTAIAILVVFDVPPEKVLGSLVGVWVEDWVDVEVEIRVEFDVVDVDVYVDVDVEFVEIGDDVELRLEDVVVIVDGASVKSGSVFDALVGPKPVSVVVALAPSGFVHIVVDSILGCVSLDSPLTENSGSCPSMMAPGIILLTFVSAVLVNVTAESTESEVSLDIEEILSDPKKPFSVSKLMIGIILILGRKSNKTRRIFFSRGLLVLCDIVKAMVNKDTPPRFDKSPKQPTRLISFSSSNVPNAQKSNQM